MKYKSIFSFSLIGLFLILQACSEDDNPTQSQNQPPVISSMITEPADSVSIHDTTLVTCMASDPDGDSLSFDWDLLSSGVIHSTEQPNVIKFNTFVNNQDPREVNIQCTASDGNGGMAVDTAFIKLFDPNSAPIISSLTADPPTITAFNDSSVVTCNATDPEGSELEFAWSTDGAPSGLRTAAGAPHRATVFPLRGDTTIIVVCEVSDGGTGVTTRTVDVAVSGITSSLSAEEETIQVGESTLITCTLLDADGEMPEGAEYEWESVGAGNVTIVETAEPNVIEWSGSAPGDYQVSVTVTGPFGVFKEKSFFMQVIE